MNPITRLKLKNLQILLGYVLESDLSFNRRQFVRRLGRRPDLDAPKTFAEKLIYLKMYYENPLQTLCADKFTVCEYVKCCGYPEILKELYQVCTSPEEIDLDRMPETFFIQCSHTQGHNFVVSKKDPARLEEIKGLYRALLKRRHHRVLRENCYRNITPRILCSEYLKQPGQDALVDYKFYCFDGEVKYFMVSYGELEHNVRNHKFDRNWNSIDHFFKKDPAIAAGEIQKPKNFDKMVEIAEKLSEPFPHVRVDLYNLDGRIVFGEMTFYSAGGFVKVASEEMDRRIGSWIDLDKHRAYMKK